MVKEAAVISIDQAKTEEKLSPKQKAEQALELRKKRVAFKAIAHKLGYSNEGVARSAIRGEVMIRQGFPPEKHAAVDLDLELELLSLDDLEAKLWLALERADPDTALKGADRVLKIKSERDRLRAKRDYSLRKF